MYFSTAYKHRGLVFSFFACFSITLCINALQVLYLLHHQQYKRRKLKALIWPVIHFTVKFNKSLNMNNSLVCIITSEIFHSTETKKLKNIGVHFIHRKSKTKVKINSRDSYKAIFEGKSFSFSNYLLWKWKQVKRKNDTIDINKPPALKRQSGIGVFFKKNSARKILLIIWSRNPIHK